MILNTCNFCTVIFTSNKIRKYCSKECSDKGRALLLKQRPSTLEINYDPKPCPRCNSLIPYSKRKNNFCSKRCAASTGHIARKKDPYRSVIYDMTRIKLIKCSRCNSEFFTALRNGNPVTILCSHFCYINTKKQNAKGIKQHLYNNQFIFQSGWELEIAQFLDQENIQWIQPDPITYMLNGKKHRYFPDFYIPILNLYLDPKNPYCISQQKEKLDIVSNLINLIYGDVSFIKNTVLNQLRL